MTSIDEKLAKDVEIKNICIDCDNWNNLHACIECAEEISSVQCKKRSALCEECWENELAGIDLADDNDYLK